MAVVAPEDDVDDAVAVRLDRDDRDLARGDEASDPQAGLQFVEFQHRESASVGPRDPTTAPRYPMPRPYVCAVTIARDPHAVPAWELVLSPPNPSARWHRSSLAAVRLVSHATRRRVLDEAPSTALKRTSVDMAGERLEFDIGVTLSACVEQRRDTDVVHGDTGEADPSV